MPQVGGWRGQGKGGPCVGQRRASTPLAVDLGLRAQGCRWERGTQQSLLSSRNSEAIGMIANHALHDLPPPLIHPPCHASCSPLIARLGLSATVGTLVGAANAKLRTEVPSLAAANPTVSLRLFDAEPLFLDYLARAAAGRLSQTRNITAPCLETSGVLLPGVSILSRCPNPNRYFFYDGSHFTSTVHRELAKDVKLVGSWHVVGRQVNGCTYVRVLPWAERGGCAPVAHLPPQAAPPPGLRWLQGNT